MSSELSVLRMIAGVSHVTVEQANDKGSKSLTARLIRDGLVTRDEQWTGCVTLTDAGYQRLDSLDSLESL